MGGALTDAAATDFLARLRGRLPEIEAAALARVTAISGPSSISDPQYSLGLRRAVPAGLAYAFASLETRVPTELPPVPTELIEQARIAVAHGVSLDMVLRRYSLGYALLSDFVIEELGRDGSTDDTLLRQVLRAQATAFDHLLATISKEYAGAAERRQRGTAEQRANVVKSLLACEPADPRELRYPLDYWHVAMISSDLGVAEAMRGLAARLDCKLLVVEVDKTVWAWLGGRVRLSSAEVLSQAVEFLSPGLPLALGEPAQGLQGWRLSHRQARAAMSVALHGKEESVRYIDVALLAAALHDELLARSLHDTYLRPLEGESDGGSALRSALGAYLAAGRNVSSAAAMLGVTRQTVSTRLRTVEERIERSLDSCAPDAEVALRVSELGEARSVAQS